MTLEQQVRQIIDHLPDDCDADDIHYQLYLLQKIHKGEAGLKKGGIPHDEFKERAAAWRA